MGRDKAESDTGTGPGVLGSREVPRPQGRLFPLRKKWKDVPKTVPPGVPDRTVAEKVPNGCRGGTPRRVRGSGPGRRTSRTGVDDCGVVD